MDVIQEATRVVSLRGELGEDLGGFLETHLNLDPLREALEKTARELPIAESLHKERVYNLAITGLQTLLETMNSQELERAIKALPPESINSLRTRHPQLSQELEHIAHNSISPVFPLPLLGPTLTPLLSAYFWNELKRNADAWDLWGMPSIQQAATLYKKNTVGLVFDAGVRLMLTGETPTVYDIVKGMDVEPAPSSMDTVRSILQSYHKPWGWKKAGLVPVPRVYFREGSERHWRREPVQSYTLADKFPSKNHEEPAPQ